MLLLVGCLWGLCLVVVSGWFTPLCFTCVLNFMLWRVCSRHCIVVSPGHVYQGGSSDWWHWQGPSRENGMEGWHRTGQTQRWNYCPAGSRHQNWQERLESILRSKFLVVSLHTHPFNGPLSGTTRVSRYQKGKTNLHFTEVRDSEWQWNPLAHMQVCTSLQTDNHASTPPLSFLQAGRLSCRPTNSVKAVKGVKALKACGNSH